MRDSIFWTSVGAAALSRTATRKGFKIGCPARPRIPFRAAAETRKVLKKISIVRGVQKHRHLFVPCLSSGRQRSIVPLVLHGGVRSTFQKEASNGNVAVEGGQVKRSQLLLVRLVNFRARLQQHLDNLHGPHLRGEDQRRDTVVVHLVNVRSVLEENLGDLWETLGCGLDQWRDSHTCLRPVDLDATPIGRPLQQPPRRVRLPAVRGPPQRGQFVLVPPNSGGARRHHDLRLEPRVRDVEDPELRQGSPRRAPRPAGRSTPRRSTSRAPAGSSTARGCPPSPRTRTGRGRGACEGASARRGCPQTPRTCSR